MCKIEVGEQKSNLEIGNKYHCVSCIDSLHITEVTSDNGVYLAKKGHGLHSPFGNMFKFSSLSLCASIAYLILLLRALLRLLGSVITLEQAMF